MNITIEQLRSAVRQCTPSAPDSYADRLWRALQRGDPRAPTQQAGDPVSREDEQET
jgi:hypothetical protein